MTMKTLDYFIAPIVSSCCEAPIIFRSCITCEEQNIPEECPTLREGQCTRCGTTNPDKKKKEMK